MRILILAIGRLKRGPETELAARYHKRLTQAGRSLGLRDIDIVEIRESRAPDKDKRILEESIALANVIPDRSATVLLDQRGRSLSSEVLTDTFRTWRDGGVQTAAFIIGGPDGLSQTIREKVDLTLAFGAATWPHQLVRVMLLEQLYRAVTILAGHPYHRS